MISKFNIHQSIHDKESLLKNTRKYCKIFNGSLKVQKIGTNVVLLPHHYIELFKKF